MSEPPIQTLNRASHALQPTLSVPPTKHLPILTPYALLALQMSLIQKGDLIQQGPLKDGYLLGALATVTICGTSAASRAVSQQGRLFTSMKHRDVGLYVVQFFKQGDPVSVVIDDRLPVDSEGRLVFAECTDGSVWAPLIEKAYAKLHQGPLKIRDANLHPVERLFLS